MSTSEEWLYNDVLDVDVTDQSTGVSSHTHPLDSEDLLDDVLTAPATILHKVRGLTSSVEEEDELLEVKDEDLNSIEDSGSARYNAEQKAKMVQARMEANRTSQGGVNTGGGPNIYAREPNRKNSVFIGNLTWWTTDQDLIQAVKDAGLKDVKNIKFFENRANGQSKGYALVELASEPLAMVAPDKLQEIVIHSQRPVVMYAARLSPHQFETKCTQQSQGKTGSSTSTTPSTNSTLSSAPSSSISSSISSSTLPFGTGLIGGTGAGGLGGAAKLNQRFTPGGKGPGALGSAPSPSPSSHSLHSGTSSLPRPPIPPIPGLPPLVPPPMPPPSSLLPDFFSSLQGVPPGLPPPFPPIPPMPHIKPGMGSVHHFGLDHKGVAPHLNPAFLQEGNMAELFAKFKGQAAATTLGRSKIDEETSDANQRNRAISSSAISRAMADANAGDFDGAIDTLRMAITLIQQSLTAGTETSQILIQSLQDCLLGIDQQASNARRSRGGRDHRHDDRERGRSSHRSNSSKHHRDRSRERRR